MKNNRPSTPITKIPKSPIIKKSTIKTVPPPLIISNTLMDQTGRPFPSAELGNLVQSLSFTHIIGADFNAKHQTWSRSTNTRGRTLQNFISLNHLKVIASLSPTYWPSHINRHPDTLDFFITNLPNRFSTEIINLNDPASDHTPVLLQIGAHPSLKKSRPTITPGTTNWNKFKDNISNKTTLNIKLKSITDVDQAIAKLTDDIQKAALDSSTQNPPYSQTLNLSPELRRLIAEKRRARSKWQYTHYPADKIKAGHGVTSNRACVMNVQFLKMT
ncbi:hypothetical protein ACI65C_006370 [Semiaphis heraclei]